MAARPLPSSGAPGSSGVHYSKIRDLASGGMGFVELARADNGPHVNKLVAIKRLHPHLEREPQFAEMFFDEAWITAGLHHQCIVDIFDWGIDDRGRYLALEFVPGESLLAVLREAKKQSIPIPIELCLFIAARAAEGLHAAHELRDDQGNPRDLVHRDVTPSNLLISIYGDVKLIDFGVAKARDKLSHTSTGTIKGKFGYMSPEQARGMSIDRRADVFSLGVVLWEMLTLKRLYRSESELEILRMIVEDPPPPVTAERPDAPPALERLIEGALAKSRDDRLGSCAELADLLWEIYAQRNGTAAERELAAFFKRVLPDRCTQLNQLLLEAEEVYHEPRSTVRPVMPSFTDLPVVSEEMLSNSKQGFTLDGGPVSATKNPPPPKPKTNAGTTGKLAALPEIPASALPAPVTLSNPGPPPPAYGDRISETEAPLLLAKVTKPSVNGTSAYPAQKIPSVPPAVPVNNTARTVTLLLVVVGLLGVLGAGIALAFGRRTQPTVGTPHTTNTSPTPPVLGTSNPLPTTPPTPTPTPVPTPVPTPPSVATATDASAPAAQNPEVPQPVEPQPPGPVAQNAADAGVEGAAPRRRRRREDAAVGSGSGPTLEEVRRAMLRDPAPAPPSP